MAEDNHGDVGFEDGLSWLPAHILHEACGHFDEEQLGRRARHYQQHHHHHHVNGSESYPLSPWKGGRKHMSGGKPRYGGSGNRALSSGGPGMQAVFLEPGQNNKSCGTGVFLPRGAGTDFQPTKKPACSPVLLPSRVVQALNINVQALGLHMPPRQDLKTNHKARTADNLVYQEDDENVRDRCYVISKDRNSSPEIFLPKEWSY